ncbi:MAG: hypothetical protein AAFQ05_04980 [Pseudomonadota bacterium]
MTMRLTAPFGGAVTQAFDIWSNWFENVGQLGFINIDLGRTEKPELERQILREVGSYGRQIGRISEALDVLIDQAKLDQSKLSAAQVTALHTFQEMVQDVKRCKER